MRLVAQGESVFGILLFLGYPFKVLRVRAYASAMRKFYGPSADLCMVGKIYNAHHRLLFFISKFLHEQVKANRVHITSYSSQFDPLCLKSS